MFLHHLQLSPNIAPLLLVTLLFLLLTRPALVTAQQIPADFLPDTPAENRGEISGTVYQDKDLPAIQAIVTVRSQPSGISRSVLSDYDGRFRIANLPNGTYRVIVESDGC